MRQLLFLSFLFTSFTASAQSDFLSNANLVWSVDITQTWEIDNASFDHDYEQGVEIIKLMRTPQNEARWFPPYFAEQVLDAAASGKLKIYNDPKCTQPLMYDALNSGFDTLVTFDPSTYEEKIVVTHTELNTQRIRAWRVRQIVSYNKKTQNWETYVYAVAALGFNPDYDERDTMSDRYKPLFWFKPDNKRPKLTSSDITWAAATKTRRKENHVNLKSLNLLKMTEGYKYPGEHLMRRFMSEPAAKYYEPADLKRQMSLKDRLAIVHQVDTVITFDPETYEEKIRIVRQDLNFEDLEYLRLCQTWYWDDRKKRLSICLDRTAAMIDIKDDDGNFRYERPIYYQMASNNDK